MTGLTTFFTIAWLVFWAYWLLSALGAKHGTGRTLGGRIPFVLTILLVFVLLRALRVGGLAVDDLALEVVGLALFIAGLGLAVWARVHLGRNWGMPMTRKDEPELVTSGPYRFVRHPIYSGILLAMLGTGLATTFSWLIAFVVFGIYFARAATVEEANLTREFPNAYPPYQAHTKMLIPFVF